MLWVVRVCLCVILDDAREAREHGLAVAEVLQRDALCAALVDDAPAAAAVVLSNRETQQVRRKNKNTTVK